MKMNKGLILSIVMFCVSIFAGQAHAINCSGIPVWNSTAAYTTGTKVQEANKAYTANYWSSGASPATHSGQWQEWILNGTCDGVTSTASSVPSSVKSSVITASSSSIVGGNCTSVQYVAGTTYNAGQLVKNAGNEYRCDIAGWCSSSAAWAYAPGTGSAWASAWTLMRSCSTVISSSSATTTSSKAPSSSSVTATSSSVGSVGNNLAFVYGAYKDVTVNTNWNTDGIQGFNTSGSLLPIAQAMPSGMKALTWAFVTGECGSSSENVAGMVPATFAATNVASFISNNKSYIVATGGSAGAFTCGSDAGFSAFINTYNSSRMIGVDFDIEGGRLNATQIAALVARVKSAQNTYPNMRFSFTIPTLGNGRAGSSVAVDLGASSPDSMGDDGHMVMAAIKAAGLKNYIINLMTMDYGPASSVVCVVSGGACQEGQTAIQAAMNLHNYYGVPYNQIEITPEIPADDGGVPFSLSNDVPAVTSFIKSKGLAGLHYWAYERDTNGLPYATGFASGLGQ